MLALLLKSSAKHADYLYLRLKLFLLLGDANFRNYYKDFVPLTFEHSAKKLKLGAKYHINHFDPDKAHEEVEKLEKLLESAVLWKEKNTIGDKDYERALNISKYKSSVSFLRASISYVRNDSYYSIVNILSDIHPTYKRKPKVLIFELKLIQLAPNNYFYNSEFFKKAQVALSTLDGKSQTICWQYIIIYCLKNGLKQQGKSILNNMGSTRFARVDTLYPLSVVSFIHCLQLRVY